MATSRLCSIPDCCKPHKAHGFCSVHYYKNKEYGDPLSPGTGATPRGAARAFLDAALKYDGDECLLWPFSGNSLGYGTIGIDGVTTYVHRIVCKEFNGEPPTQTHEAAHSCGNGSSGCCTGRHLSWKTRLDNQSDRMAHGTHIVGERHGRHKLTSQEVLAIKSLIGTEPQAKIARRFGISQGHVCEIATGKKWAHLS